jgi:hypothetical protein
VIALVEAHFRSVFPAPCSEEQIIMTELRRILPADDKATDLELALAALEDHRLANEVVIVRDGEVLP